MNRVGTIRTVIMAPNISLSGKDVNPMTIFVSLVIKNSMASPMNFDNFRLQVSTESFVASSLPTGFMVGEKNQMKV